MGEPCTAITHVLVHTRRNLIELVPGDHEKTVIGESRNETGVLDIGRNGALIGLELGADYFSVSPIDGADDDLVRSVEIDVGVCRDEHGLVLRIELPRSGSTYEITYPIGNRCWRRVVNGKTIESCVTTITT